MDIFSRAHRILKRLERYVDLSGGHTLPLNAPELPRLRPNERPVGVYFNDHIQFSETVFFSSTGIYVYRLAQWDYVPFQDVDRAVIPESKQNTSGFMLLLRDGKTAWLPITGVKSGRFYDAFEVLRFVHRVLNDVKVSEAIIKR